MPGRRPNPRQAKSHRCYSIAEAGDLYGVHQNTVRNWLKSGLGAIDTKRPILIHGAALNTFHQARRRTNRKPCGSGELFCFGCRQPRRPAADMFDFVSISERVGTITAICPVCERFMSQRVNSSRYARFTAEIAAGDRLGHQSLSESPYPGPDCDFQGERKGQ